MTNASNNDAGKVLAILASIATIIGTCVAIIALIPAFFQWLSPREPAPVASQIARKTSPPATANKQRVALSEKFDESSGSYDTSVWECRGSCSIENIFLRSGILAEQSKDNGYSFIISRSEWNYVDLVSFSGKFQIDKNSTIGTLGWLALADNGAGCGFYVTENPYLQCEFGPRAVDGARDYEYTTSESPVNLDTWYSIKIEFDQNTNAIRYYLDNTLLGIYTPAKRPDIAVQISLGLSSPQQGQVYLDDIVLMKK